MDLDKSGFELYLNLKKNLISNVENIYIKNVEKYFQKILTGNFSFKEEIWEYIKLNIELLTKEDIKILTLIDKYGTLEQEIFLD